MRLLEFIFSIKNNQDKTHKVITILGFKIKIKRKYKFDKNVKINNFGINKKSNDVVVLGNGPSLKDTFADEKSFNFIKNKDIFVVNSFMQDDKFFELKPKYLCLMDPIYWATDNSKDLLENLNSDNQKLKMVDWNLTIFMPVQAKENNVFKNLLNTNKNIKFNFINTQTSASNDKNVRYAMYKQNLAMPAIQNVLGACIYVSINIGYKQIFIFGADHSWHLSLIVNKDNIPCIVDKHFYDKEEVTNYTPVYKDASWNTPFKISELFNAYTIVHQQYEILEDYSKYIGSAIYNSSKFSCIDAFERNYDITEENINAK